MTKRPKNKAGFTERLLNLISEPQFIKFENILSEPNFFKIVGRTHYERWHSCFLGWLLDSSGSHLLSDYTLLRFLLLLLDERCYKSKNHDELKFLKILPTVDFSDIEVFPNENISKETSIRGVGRFDIFISAKYNGLGNIEGNLNCIIELKIDSIYDALVSTGTIDYSTSDLQTGAGRTTGRLAVKINKKVFSNETVRLLFRDVLEFLVDNNFLEKLPLPWGTSNHRYIITNESDAKHPNGRDFFYPINYSGYTMESHYARERGLKVLGDLCKKLEIDFEIIET